MEKNTDHWIFIEPIYLAIINPALFLYRYTLIIPGVGRGNPGSHWLPGVLSGFFEKGFAGFFTGKQY